MCQDKTDDKPSGTIDYSQIATYFKYCGDDEQVIKGIFETHTIRFTQPWVLNDPLEFNPTLKFRNNGENYRPFLFDGVLLPSEELRLRFHLIESQVNRFGILSLTKVPDSFDMWSGYANGHHGFLLELKSDFNELQCMLSPAGKPYPVRAVEPVNEYAIDIDEYTDADGRIDERAITDKLFYTKLSRWDEKEYRMVRPFSDLPGYTPLTKNVPRDMLVHPFAFSLDCIGSVTFGACMSAENKRDIMSACKGSKIEFWQALIIRDQKDELGHMGRVVRWPAADFARLLDAPPSHFIVDSAHVEDQLNTVEIGSLSELPYWENGPAWVQSVYKNEKRRCSAERA